ncbi:hypothetical protein ACSBR1_027860 [Camellia fascicularis]
MAGLIIVLFCSFVFSVCLAQNVAQTSVEAAGSSSLPPSLVPCSTSIQVFPQFGTTMILMVGVSCTYYLFSVAIVGGGNHSVVWSTNVGHPVKEGVALQLTVDGELVLRNSDGDHVWSTNTLGKSVVGMNMTAWGNFVLFNNEGAIVWQSFDYPTNTLLVGLQLYEDQKLISSSSNLWARGLYFATLKLATGFATYMGGKGQPQMYYQLVPAQTSTTSRGPYYAELQRGSDGHLKIFHHSNAIGWREIVDMITHDLGLLLCLAHLPLTRSTNFNYLVEVRNVSYFNLIDEDAGFPNISDIERCKEICLLNCSCGAVFFSKRTSKGTVPDTCPPASLSRNRRNLKAIIALSCAGALLIFVVAIVTCFVILRPSCSEDGEDCMKQVPGSLVRFSYEQLCVATKDFKERLGEKACRLLVYEYMTNGSLDSWIFWNNQRPCLNWQARKKIILHIAKGLAYPHEAGRE